MIILKREGTPRETFMKHTTSNPLQQLYQSMDTGRKRLASLPVCPKCERTGFRDKGWVTERTMCCAHCGYRGPATHVLSAYLSEACYKS